MTAPAAREWVFAFPAPTRLLNMNERLHWTTERARAKAWRTTARINVPKSVPTDGALPAALVHVALPVLGARRRDPHNYFPTVKHIVDGLVDAGLWPDDTPEYVTTLEPTLVPYPAGQLHRPVVVTITERGAL